MDDLISLMSKEIEVNPSPSKSIRTIPRNTDQSGDKEQMSVSLFSRLQAVGTERYKSLGE